MIIFVSYVSHIMWINPYTNILVCTYTSILYKSCSLLPFPLNRIQSHRSTGLYFLNACQLYTKDVQLNLHWKKVSHSLWNYFINLMGTYPNINSVGIYGNCVTKKNVLLSDEIIPIVLFWFNVKAHLFDKQGKHFKVCITTALSYSCQLYVVAVTRIVSSSWKSVVSQWQVQESYGCRLKIPS